LELAIGASFFFFSFLLLYGLSFLPVGLVSAMAYLGWDGRMWYYMAGIANFIRDFGIRNFGSAYDGLGFGVAWLDLEDLGETGVCQCIAISFLWLRKGRRWMSGFRIRSWKLGTERFGLRFYISITG
jgi:hypothetical protein